jgi:hypothetical protein
MKGSALIPVAVAGLGLAAGAFAQTAKPAASGSPWIHVRVEEAKNDSKVNVNLPLSLVQVALDAAPEKISEHGKIHLGHEGHDLSVADMRRIWAELKKTGEADLVSVEEKDQTVKVGRRGDQIQVRVEKKGGGQQVAVDVPVAVVDALLSSDGDELNVKAALGELQKLRGDVVHVNDEHSTVRIWIDEKN